MVCRSELRWHALNYSLDPSIVLRGSVDFYKSNYQDSRPVDDVVREAPSVFQLSSLFGGPNRLQEKEKTRREIAESWGVWIWLVADFVPDGMISSALFRNIDPSQKLTRYSYTSS